MFSRQNSFLISEWERARYISTMALNSNPYIKKPYQPKDLFSLPNDRVVRKISKKEFVENIESIKKHLPFNVA